MQILRGLKEQYNNVRSNILMMDPMPPIAKVFSYAVQQERQIVSTNMLGNTSLINDASSTSGSNISCSYCGRDNHIVDNCFKKNGYSPDFSAHKRGRGGRGSYSRGKFGEKKY